MFLSCSSATWEVSSTHRKMNINKYNYLYHSTARRAFESTAPTFAATCDVISQTSFNRFYSLVFIPALVRVTSGATFSRSLAREANFVCQRLIHLLQLLVLTGNEEKLSQPGCDLYIWTDHPGTQDALHYWSEYRWVYRKRGHFSRRQLSIKAWCACAFGV